MTSTKYIGMDVHKESMSIAAMNGAGKIVMESVQACSTLTPIPPIPWGVPFFAAGSAIPSSR
ncbi:MAG TPA: hypothetical protein VK525_17635 [Candidatus Saccharimonadales bacterium]|nr:hypothetical protein [Candidatus Saccharimonadales bacterium]